MLIFNAAFFLNAECYVEKYFCNQDTAIAVCLKNQKLNLGISEQYSMNFSSFDESWRQQAFLKISFS